MKVLAPIFLFSIVAFTISCTAGSNHGNRENKPASEVEFPSDLIESHDQWKILLGNGKSTKSLKNFEDKDYFYIANDGMDWVVYKTPNSGITSRTSHNTRTELGQKRHWTPKEGGRLRGTVKVMHVSTSGDARVAASFAVVVGQVHSHEGHENEPLKIFYKKFPGHTKGSVFWNYEINTDGDNADRWDFSTAVWGHDMSGVGTAPEAYPADPDDGIALGEEFRYEVNVYSGIMYLTFESEGHETKAFTKDLTVSEFSDEGDLPQQIIDLYSVIGRDGTEKSNAYEGELQYFKQGAYNQTNGGDPETNMVWSTGSNIFDGDVAKQYANGSYAEVWFRSSSIGPGTNPNL